MGYHDHNATSLVTRLLRRPAETSERVSPQPNRGEAAPDARRSASAALLSEISEFLILHSLDITPGNLSFAHAVKSGSNLRLCEQVCNRELSGQPINQQWIDGVVNGGNNQRGMFETMLQMMDKLEGSMTRFEASARRASDTTGQCRDQFAQHMQAVSVVAPDAISRRFIELSQSMLETLQRIDNEMRRSQSETRELRESLEQARMDANNDHLTRLPNRRAFERRFTQFHEEVRNQGESLFVAICDIDHFKRVNDLFGHETGDSLLRAIAAILKQIASSDCFIARHGGEEFVLLFRGCAREDAVSQIERAQRALKERHFIARRTGEPVGVITFSAGIADVMEEKDPRAALAKADEALYRAKEMGRDRVVVA